MAMLELMAFANAGILLIGFALVLIVLSASVTQINSVAAFANAQSVATAIGTRLITSPNCFAYQYTQNYYAPYASGTTAKIYSVTETDPGVVSPIKFTEDNFLSCAEYAYTGEQSSVPFSQYLIPAFAGISAVLTDTQNPTNLGPGGSAVVTNYGQLNYGDAFPSEISSLQSEATTINYVLLGISIAINAAIAAATAGTSAAAININLIFAVGANGYDNSIEQYALGTIVSSEASYTESFPVQIQFTNSQNQPLYQDAGMLFVTIHYSDAAKGLAI